MIISVCQYDYVVTGEDEHGNLVQMLVGIHDPGMEENGLFNYHFNFTKQPICEQHNVMHKIREFMICNTKKLVCS